MKAIFYCLLLSMGRLAAFQTVLVDPDFSPYSGSANLMTAQELLVLAEDHWITKGGRDSTLKVWGRTAEAILFWHNVNMMAAVTQHEVFGHGYRLRELGVHPKKYTITPWGGATYFEVKDSFKVGDLLAVTVAGLEAEGILARDIKMEWVQRGEIDGRLATTYTQAEQSLFWYTIISQLGRLIGDVSEGNDVENYLFLQNRSYTSDRLTLGQLTRWSIFNWLDPMTFYGYYAFFYYMAEGKPWSFPMISLGETVRYLPNMRIAYAPYAPEAYFENFLSIGGKPLYFYVKGGKRSVGIGAAYDYLFVGHKGKVGFRFDGWRQGVFVTGATIGELQETGEAFRPALNKRRYGAAFSVTGQWNVHPRVALYGELGGKTKGYLPGYGLDKEIVGRVGLKFLSTEKDKEGYNRS